MPKISKDNPKLWFQLPYIALEEENFLWTLNEVLEFDQLWEDGASIQYMADYFDRTEDQLALLIMDRCKKEKIKPRKYGILGGRFDDSKLQQQG